MINNSVQARASIKTLLDTLNGQRDDLVFYTKKIREFVNLHDDIDYTLNKETLNDKTILEFYGHNFNGEKVFHFKSTLNTENDLVDIMSTYASVVDDGTKSPSEYLNITELDQEVPRCFYAKYDYNLIYSEGYGQAIEDYICPGRR